MQHHATAYAGTSLEEVTLPAEIDIAHVDTDVQDKDRFGIDDVRELRYAAQQRPVENSKRIFIIICRVLPVEAQNALLKLFEEPPATAEFHLIVPSLSTLVPTLRSRMQISSGVPVQTANKIFKDFLRADYKSRLETVATLAKAKDVDSMQLISSGAVQYVDTLLPTQASLAAKVLHLATNFAMPGASKKMLLEDLALLLPLDT